VTFRDSVALPAYFKRAPLGAAYAGFEFSNVGIEVGAHIIPDYVDNKCTLLARYIHSENVGWYTVPLKSGDVFMVSVRITNPSSNVYSGPMIFVSLSNCSLSYTQSSQPFDSSGDWSATVEGIFLVTGANPRFGVSQSHSNVAPFVDGALHLTLSPIVEYTT